MIFEDLSRQLSLWIAIVGERTQITWIDWMIAVPASRDIR